MSCNRKISIALWNLRGLGDNGKCVVVRDVFASYHPTIAFLQETKLNDVPVAKFKSFLPSNLFGHCFIPAGGSRGGIATAWNENQLTLLSSTSRWYTLIVVLSMTNTELQLTLTNVYGPYDHSHSAQFLDELQSLSQLGFLEVVKDAWQQTTRGISTLNILFYKLQHTAKQL
jgi:hypothetical protein